MKGDSNYKSIPLARGNETRPFVTKLTNIKVLPTPPLMERETQVGTLPTENEASHWQSPRVPTPPLMERTNSRPTRSGWLSSAGITHTLPGSLGLSSVALCPALLARDVGSAYLTWDGGLGPYEGDSDDGSVWSDGTSYSMSSNVALVLEPGDALEDPHGRRATFWGLHGLLNLLPSMMERGE